MKPEKENKNSVIQELEGVYKYAPLVFEITEMHRKHHHYSTRHLIARICEVIQYVPELLVQEAFKKYKEKKIPPHPNYFKITCTNLVDQNGGLHTFGKIL